MMSEWFDHDIYEERIVDAVRNLLDKLEIKSAKDWQTDRVMRSTMTNYGAPDKIFMDPHTLAAFHKAFNKP